MMITKAIVFASLLLSVSASKKSKKKRHYETDGSSDATTIIIKTLPLPVPVPVPVSVPADDNTNRIDDTPNCIICEDIVTPWMNMNGKDCASWELTAKRCQDKTQYWLNNKFCRFTCADRKLPYDGDVCCDIQPDEPIPAPPPPTPSPTPAPTCTKCTNIETSWMNSRGIDCTDEDYTIERCQTKTNYWRQNKFCQQTCFKLAYPYDDDNACCEVPTYSPTPSPTYKPTKSPTNKPTKSPTNKPTKSPTDKPTASPIDTDSCVPCTNKPSPQMAAAGYTCGNWHATADSCFDKSVPWKWYKYCEESCDVAGFPYEQNKNCCTATSRTDTLPELRYAGSDDLNECEGDCDRNSDCKSGLVCFQRSGFDKVPSNLCSGEAEWGVDYCVDPSKDSDELTFLGQEGPWGRCRGDCDDDEDCRPGLICYHRSGEENNVPGCGGRAVEDVDYCIDPPTSAPTPMPTRKPTKSPTPKPTPQVINRGDNCVICTDHPTPWMEKNHKTCEDWSLTPYRCSAKSSYYNFWERERFCALTCAKNGKPYPGPRCCGVDNLESDDYDDDTGGSDDVSEDDNDCFQYSKQCSAYNPCKDPNACCSPWGYCGYSSDFCGTCCQHGRCWGDRLLLRGSGEKKLVDNVTLAQDLYG